MAPKLHISHLHSEFQTGWVFIFYIQSIHQKDHFHYQKKTLTEKPRTQFTSQEVPKSNLDQAVKKPINFHSEFQF